MAIRDRIRRGPDLVKEGITIARLSFREACFEILIRPTEALEYKLGKSTDLSKILVADAIFTDAKKGMKASDELILKYFQTTDPLRIADVIIRRGELLITTQQRRQFIEEKRKQIIDFICKHCVDPSTKLPPPPLRVEQAMDQCRLSIDPFIDAEEQAKKVIEALKPVLPLTMEEITIAIKVPSIFTSQAYGLVKRFGVIAREEWQKDGSWIAMITVPIGSYMSFLEKMNKITHGSVQVKVLT